MFECPKTLITEKFDNLSKFWWIFSLLERGEGGFVVKLVADRVIHQHMFYFTLPVTCFLDNNLYKVKKRYDCFSQWKSW